ncbi:MAG TPA: hypothetical protein VEC06_09070 [Paucimonas sp.]|nr:hypothetical protein [Paucimonas sp.]
MIGVVDRPPSPSLHLLEGRSGVVVPALVVPENFPAFVGDPCQVGNIVGERAELSFAILKKSDAFAQVGELLFA